MDTQFLTEDGTPVGLRDLVDRPTILALVYYECPNICDYLLIGISGVVHSLLDDGDVDFRVVTLSIDSRETPVQARQARRIATAAVQRPLPGGVWTFLTGEEEQIRAVANAVGFHYAERGTLFDHPVGLVVLSPHGKVVRYLLGADFLPADVKLSLLEAATGTVGATIAKVLRICFTVEPGSHRMVFRTLQVVATVTITLAVALAVYLVLSGRKRARRVTRTRGALGHP